MYPDLSYILHDLFGTRPDNWTSIFKTFGMFLALAFLASGYVVYREMLRKEQEGLLPKVKLKKENREKMALREAGINGLIGFFIFFKLPYIVTEFPTFKSDPAGTIFSWKGMWLTGIIGGVIMGYYYYRNNMKNQSLESHGSEEYSVSPARKVGDLILICAIFGILGARLFSIFESWDEFVADPMGVLFSGSGLTVYGGVILGFVAGYVYVKRLGLNPIHIMDIAGLAIIMGSAVGRMGCHFAGDGDWGIVNTLEKPGWFVFPDWAWSSLYPRNVLRQGIPLENCEGHYCTKLAEAVYPTPVYEITAFFLIFAVLWWLRKRIHIPGMLFFVFLIFYGLERYFIEIIRVNPRYDLMGLNWSLSQAIAVVFVLIGISGVLALRSGYLKKFSGIS